MKTKIYIVTGFLGSGKTTLLKKILRASADLSTTIVLVNEFGEIGIDSALIKSTATANVVEISSGCICCSVKSDLIQALLSLQQEYSPERIVIETTGVADPLSIIEAIDSPILSTKFCVEKIITVLDYEFWEARAVFGSVFKSQLEHGDIILLNKIDNLVNEPTDITEVLQEIKKECSQATIIPTLHCNIAPDIFWSRLELEDTVKNEDFRLQIYDSAKHFDYLLNSEGSVTAKEAGFVTFTFRSKTAIDEEKFTDFLDSQPLELFRIKGPVKFLNKTSMLNYVGGKTHWQNWPETPQTCLAFIGWGVVKEQVVKQLTMCLAERQDGSA